MGHRLETTQKRLRSLEDEMARIAAEALREHHTFDWMLDRREQRIFRHPAWPMLPVWAQERLNGMFAGAYRLIESQLYDTLVLDGNRLCSKIPEHRARMEGRWADINAQNATIKPDDPAINTNGNRGMACYLVDGEWLPWREADRKAERVRWAELGN